MLLQYTFDISLLRTMVAMCLHVAQTGSPIKARHLGASFKLQTKGESTLQRLILQSAPLQPFKCSCKSCNHAEMLCRTCPISTLEHERMVRWRERVELEEELQHLIGNH